MRSCEPISCMAGRVSGCQCARLGSAFCKLKNEVSRDLFGFPCGPLGPETHPRYLSCLINRIDVNLVFE